MKVLITGSVLSSNEASIDVYKKLTNLCILNNYEVSSPLDTMKFNGTDKERYKRALSLIDDSDFIIAEVSTPSTGQGIELGYALTKNKPILSIAKNDSKVSSLIKGCIDITYYNDITDIENEIINRIKES